MKRLMSWRRGNKNKNKNKNKIDELISSWEIINPSDDNDHDHQTLSLMSYHEPPLFSGKQVQHHHENKSSVLLNHDQKHEDIERPRFSGDDVPYDENESVELVDDQNHDQDEQPRFSEEEYNTHNDDHAEQMTGSGVTIKVPGLFFTELDKPFRMDPSVFDPYKFPARVCDYSRAVMSDQVNALDETDKPLRSTYDDVGDQVNGLDETDKLLISTDDVESVYNDDDVDDEEYDYDDDNIWIVKQRTVKVGKKANNGIMKKSKKMPRYYYNRSMA